MCLFHWKWDFSDHVMLFKQLITMLELEACCETKNVDCEPMMKFRAAQKKGKLKHVYCRESTYYNINVDAPECKLFI